MKKLFIHEPSGELFTDFVANTRPEDGLHAFNAAYALNGQAVHTGLGESLILPSFDFETYSEAGYAITPQEIDSTIRKFQPAFKVKGLGSQGKGGLPVVGTPAYAEHESTEVLCLYYNLKDGKERRGWIPGTPLPQDLFDYIQSGGLIEAWNITFEFYIWNLVCVRKYGFPPLPLGQCRCAMAKSRRHSLPGSLGLAAKVLGTEQKDKRGTQLIQKLTRPHTPTKNRKDIRWTPATAWDDFVSLYLYCDQDTVAEDNASALIPDLTRSELATWQTDQLINVRGVQVDTLTLDAALDVLGQAERKYTAELKQITGGAVCSVNEVGNLKDWLHSQGVSIPDIQKDTVSDYLALDWVQGRPRRALEIRAILGAANVKKLRTLRLQVSSDGRLRDQYIYCGADRTGRWSAGGVQLQNITAKGPKSAECEGCEKIFCPVGGTCPHCGSALWHTLPEWTIDGILQAIEDVRTRSLQHVEKVWGDAIEVLCGILRGLFMAPEGNDLICADFSSIEAVAAACLARCQWRIEAFARGECIYTLSASKITGTPLEVYKQYKQEHGGHHPDRKKIGKIAELASGYGGWIGAWRNFGADMEDNTIKEQVLAWRDASPEIVEMWGGQFRQVGAKPWDAVPEYYGLEGMAIKAILNPGQCFSYIDITYGVYGDVLYCRLPSGRFLHYHRPRLVDGTDKLNRGPCYKITFEGYNSNSQKGPVGWHRMDTYGGRLFENVVQAVSADIQADALKRLEANGYSVVMHTHDEATCEVPEGWGSVDHMCAIMAERPAWASWWPIKAAGWRDKRYQKD